MSEVSNFKIYWQIMTHCRTNFCILMPDIINFEYGPSHIQKSAQKLHNLISKLALEKRYEKSDVEFRVFFALSQIKHSNISGTFSNQIE